MARGDGGNVSMVGIVDIICDGEGA
jgi:hypothetical protein